MKKTETNHNCGNLPVFILYGILSIAFTYPLILNLTQEVPGDIPCDAPMFVWNNWNFGESLLEKPHNPFIAHKILYPFEPNCVLHAYTVFRNAVVVAASSFMNPIAAFNIVTLLMFFFSAIGAYILTRRFVSNRFACFISGIIFSFCSYKLARLSGHYNLTDTAFIPFYILSLFKSLEKEKIKYYIYSGALLALAGYCCYYYFVLLVLFTILFYVYYLVPELQPSFVRKNFVTNRLSGKNISLIIKHITLLFGIPALFISVYIIIIGPITPPPFSARSASRPLLILILLAISNWALKHKIEYKKWTASLLKTFIILKQKGIVQKVIIMVCAFIILFLPVLINLLQEYKDYPSEVGTVNDYPRIIDYFSFAGRGNASLNKYVTHSNGNPIERRVYLGIIPLALSFYAWKKFRKNAYVKFWILTGILFFILSLGPSFKVNDRGLFWMPYNLIQAIPFIRGAREPSRYIILAMLAIGILSAFSISSILKKVSKLKSAVIIVPVFALLLFFIIAADFATVPNDMIDLSTPNFYKSLSLDSEDYTILELPFKIQGKGRELGGDNYSYGLYQYYQTIHNKRLLSGYIVYIPYKITDYFQNIGFINDLCILQNDKGSDITKNKIIEQPSKIEAVRVIKLFDIRYIILHKKDISPQSIVLLKKYIMQNLHRLFEEIEDSNDLIIFKRTSYKAGLFINKNLIGKSFNLAFLEGWSSMQSDKSGKFRYMINKDGRIVFHIDNIHDYHIEITISPMNSLNQNISLKFWMNDKHIQTFKLEEQKRNGKIYKISIPINKMDLRSGINFMKIHQDRVILSKPLIKFNSIFIKPVL